jgi:hypothetical protein
MDVRPFPTSPAYLHNTNTKRIKSWTGGFYQFSVDSVPWVVSISGPSARSMTAGQCSLPKHSARITSEPHLRDAAKHRRSVAGAIVPVSSPRQNAPGKKCNFDIRGLDADAAAVVCKAESDHQVMFPLGQNTAGTLPPRHRRDWPTPPTENPFQKDMSHSAIGSSDGREMEFDSSYTGEQNKLHTRLSPSLLVAEEVWLLGTHTSVDFPPWRRFLAPRHIGIQFMEGSLTASPPNIVGVGSYVQIENDDLEQMLARSVRRFLLR